MRNLTTLALVLALQVLAGSVLLNRLHTSGLVDVSQAWGRVQRALLQLNSHGAASLAQARQMLQERLGISQPDASTLGSSAGSSCGWLDADEFAVASRRVVLGDRTVPAVVLVRSGKIHTVAELPAGAGNLSAAAAAALGKGVLRGARVLDYGDAVVAPGIVDTHVHMNEPGRTDWEGMETATRAAAAGGVTVVVDMPLNSAPCTTSAALLRDKLAATQGKLHVDAAFWGGLVPDNAHNASALADMLAVGALGLKAFMAPSGINDFPNVSAEHVAAALPVLRAHGRPLYVHAELVDDTKPQGDPRAYATYLASRPRAWEAAAVRQLLAALRAMPAGGAKDAGRDAARGGGQDFRLHIAHLANADLLPELAAAKQEGLPLSVETCPHYLTFAAEDVADGATALKCAPPLREAANREALWAGLRQGTIDMIASDHSPAPPEMKKLEQGDFLAAWGGIAGLQYSLPAVWDGAARHGATPADVSRWLSRAPAALAGLRGRKGVLARGADADILVWQPEQTADTSHGALQHRHKVTPYARLALRGRVAATFVRGRLAFDAERGVSSQACGSVILSNRDDNVAKV